MRAWIIVLLVIFTIGSAYFLQQSLIIDAIEIDMEVKVGDRLGLNADNDAIRFGTVMPGTEAERIILITNTHSVPVTATIKTSGTMGNWVRVSENGFALLPGEGKNITFIVHPPVSEFGTYKGKAVVVINRQLRFSS